MASERDDRIRQRAYEIWQQEGEPDGREREHWERACRDIDDEERTAFSLTTGQGAGSAPASQTQAGRSSGIQPQGTSPGRGTAAAGSADGSRQPTQPRR
jgi:hypothetical protein